MFLVALSVFQLSRVLRSGGYQGAPLAVLRARLPDLLFARCSLDGEIDASSHAEGNLAGVATVFIWLAAVEAYVS